MTPDSTPSELPLLDAPGASLGRVDFLDAAGEGTAPLLSFPGSFGRALVSSRVPMEDVAVWQAGLQAVPGDHRYYELIHRALQEQFEHYYLVLKNRRDVTFAVQPFFLVEQDICLGLPSFVKNLVATLRRYFPGAFKLRTLMVGCSAGEGRLAQPAAGVSARSLVEALGEVLPRVASALKAELIVFKDFPKAERARLDDLDRFGFKRVPSMPATRLELNYQSFDHYLETALSAKMRKDLRRKFRKAASGIPITMEVVSDLTPFIDEAFPLYEQVVRKSKLKFEILTPSYFCALGQKMPDKVVFLVWRQRGRMVAFNSFIVHAGVLYDSYVGFDYTVALDYHVYFLTRRDIFAWAIEKGYHTYYSAPLNYDPKLHLRQKLSPLDIHARLTRAWLNPFFRPVLPLMEPTRYDPILKRFSNAHELA
jgi:hypothetical protein